MKLLLIENRTLFREGMCLLLSDVNAFGSLEVFAAGSLEETLKIIDQTQLDIILLDSSLHDTTDMEALVQIVQAAPTTPVLILSADDHYSAMKMAFSRGAVGYLQRSVCLEELIEAMDTVMCGKIYMPPAHRLADMTYQSLTKQEKNTSEMLLSVRQVEVLHQVLQGSPNKVISENLNISTNTVKAHLSTIFKRLGAANRTEAVYFASKAGLI